MAPKKIDYSKCVIYAIRPKDENLKFCYIGSTSDFNRRKYQHKFKCHCPNIKEYNYKLYKIIRELGGWSEFEMVIIENFPCNNSSEATQREREIHDLFNANMNSRVPKLTEEEAEEYTQKINARRRDIPKTDCPCGGCYLYQNKCVHIRSQKHQNWIKENESKK